MGRRPQPERKTRLLASCTENLLTEGLDNATLARLAAAAGTSPRMLIYHFATRDRLVAAAIHEARRQQRVLFDPLFEFRRGTPYPDVLSAVWDRITGPTARPYMRLFQQLHDQSGQTLWPDFPTREIVDWIPAIRAGLESDHYSGAEVLATAVIGTLRGLLSDLEATNDHERTAAAWRTTTQLLFHAPRIEGSPNPRSDARPVSRQK